MNVTPSRWVSLRTGVPGIRMVKRPPGGANALTFGSPVDSSVGSLGGGLGVGAPAALLDDFAPEDFTPAGARADSHGSRPSQPASTGASRTAVSNHGRASHMNDWPPWV